MRDRKRILVIPEPDASWLQDIIRARLQGGDYKTAEKDLHIVAIATTAADQRLLSGDDKAREKYKRVAEEDPRLARLHWVNPFKQVGVRTWLLARAPERLDWTLSAP
jgi:hypothetical protein